VTIRQEGEQSVRRFDGRAEVMQRTWLGQWWMILYILTREGKCADEKRSATHQWAQGGMPK